VAPAVSARRPFLRTYVALALLGGLGAYIYFVESKQDGKPEKAKEKVLALDKSKVKELTLTPKDGEAVRLVREGKDWKMVAPLMVPADSGEAESLVSSLESMEIDEVAAETAPKLGDFGLESPRITVGVLLQGASEPLKLLFGDKTPDGSGIYAKLPSQPRVFTVASYVDSAFGKKPFDLRDRDVLHVKRDEIQTLEVHGPEGDYTLARKDKEWAFTKPLQTLAGRWSVDGLLGLLEGLRMEKVVAEDAKDLKSYGLTKSVRSLVVGLAGGKSKTLEIGGSPEPKKYYARDAAGSIVAVIPGAIVDDLAKGMKELRAKRLLDVATYEVEWFDVEQNGKRAYTRTSTKDAEGIDVYHWKRSVPDGKDLETNKIQDVFFKVGGVEVADFVDTPGEAALYGLDKPVLKVNLRYAGGKPPIWFELGQKDGATYARRMDDASLLKLDPTKAEELLKAFKEL
jgi:hypothetical protein